MPSISLWHQALLRFWILTRLSSGALIVQIRFQSGDECFWLLDTLSAKFMVQIEGNTPGGIECPKPQQRRPCQEYRFLMDKAGNRSLSPAFDVAYAYNPDGPWTSQHQMSLNGKRDNFVEEDFSEFAKTAGLKRGRDKTILAEVRGATSRWTRFAEQAGVAENFRKQIAELHRVE